MAYPGDSPSGSLTCRDLILLPKAHLHLHLEGAMRLGTLRELCAKNGIVMPAVPEPAGDGTYDGFGPFKDLYLGTLEALKTPEDLNRLVWEVVEDASRDGVRWLELHFYAAFEAYQRNLGPATLVWSVVRKAAAEAGKAWGVGVAFIAGAERWLPVQDAVDTAKLVVELRKQHSDPDGAPLAPIVAFGLQGPEEGFPPQPFAEAFAIARAGGMLAVPHAGEHAGAASVAAALDVLGAQRLAHGVRACEDPALLARLSELRVCCDVCPHSNVMLQVAPSLAQHPLAAMIAAGVPCTVNADDPLLFRGVGLVDEFEALRTHMCMSDQEIANIARTSFEFCGCPDKEFVAHCIEGVDAWLASKAPSPPKTLPTARTISPESNGQGSCPKKLKTIDTREFRFPAGCYGPPSVVPVQAERVAFAAHELDAISACFRKLGYVVVRDARMAADFDLDQVASELAAEQRRLAEGELDNALGGYGKDLGAPGQATIDGSAFEHFVGGATARSPAAQRAWRHSALTKIVRALIGQNAWTVDSGMEGGTIYQDARADQGSKYSRIGWHTDLQGATPNYPDVFPSVAVTIHIDGTSPANGFLRIVPGSHHGGCMGMPEGFEYIEGEVPLYCKPGDVLLHTYTLWHSAARATADGAAGVRRHIRGTWYAGQQRFPSDFPFDQEFNKNAAR